MSLDRQQEKKTETDRQKDMYHVNIQS